MKRIAHLLIFVLSAIVFTMCKSDKDRVEINTLSPCDLSFFGDSTAVFVVKDLQNGYRISLIHNKQLDLVHFERGDSISRYCAIHELPFDLRHYEEDSIGVFYVDIDFPILQLDTLGGSEDAPEMFFMDVNFDCEEEFVVMHEGYNRYYYACFDLVKGNSNGACPGLLEVYNEPPFNNIVSGLGTVQSAYTVFDRKKKEVYIYETMGCCSYYKTWAKYFEGDNYGNEAKIKVVKQEEHEWWADGKEHIATYKLVNDSLKLVEKRIVE